MNLRRLSATLNGLRRSPTGLIGLAIVGFYVILAVFGPILAPFEFDQRVSEGFDVLRLPPSGEYWFGTDTFGRDVFSRVVIGSRSIIVLAFAASGLGVFFGTVVGLVSGWYGRWVDEVLMRIMDVFMSFPAVLLALLLIPALEPQMERGFELIGLGDTWFTDQIRIMALIFGISIVFMPRVARVVRSTVLEVKTNEFIDAARARGESSRYIMTQEILPNATGPIVVEASIRISYAILLSATLGYLGLGLEPPSPDWGLQVAQAQERIQSEPWMLLFPAAAIASLVVGVNLLSDGLREVLDVEDSGPITDTSS